MLGGKAAWLVLLLATGTLQMALGTALTGSPTGQVFYAVLAFLILSTSLWVGARVLVLGRLTWRQMLPTAVFTAIGLLGAIVGAWYVTRDVSFLRWVRRQFTRHGTPTDTNSTDADTRSAGTGAAADEP